MGQKTHPHGLRVGIHRKWNNSWYGDSVENKNLFFQHKSVEEIIKTLLYLYTYTKISSVRCVLVVDIKFFKYNSRQVFIFVLFYKFRTKRRRQAVRKKKILKWKLLEKTKKKRSWRLRKKYIRDGFYFNKKKISKIKKYN